MSAVLFSAAALAADGDGGRGGGGQAAGFGGPLNLSGTGTNGGDGSLVNSIAGGGGGGGSGVTGGAGGAGYGVSGTAGGTGGGAATTVGGVVTGGAGGNAQASTTSNMGGGGGGGGGHAYSGDLTNLTGTTYIGGAGGSGGSAVSGGSGGGGGGGGIGAVVTGTSGGTATLAPTAINGGNGGAGSSGARGGAGGSGLYIDSPTGTNHITIGATLTGGAGGNGDSFGGGGGVGLQVWNATGTTTVDLNGTVRGGFGGTASDLQLAAQHTGGYGGYGVVIGNAPGTILNVNADIIAGNGGAGIEQGGDGGVAISADDTTININGGTSGVTIVGGAGGTGTTQGNGGQGIYGGGLNITLTDKVILSGGGSAPAIEFYGTNSLTLVANLGNQFSPQVGAVVHNAGAIDTLTLSGSGAGSLAASVTNGFVSVTKSGTSTWTLVGTGDGSVGQWTLSGGTLSIAANVFGSSAALTLSGGTLATTADVALSNAISVSADSGLLVSGGQTLSLSGALSGSGALSKVGGGTLTLTNANGSYTGAVSVSDGTLALSGSGSLSAASGITIGAGTLDISGTTSGTTVNGLASSNNSARVVLGSQTLSVNNSTVTSFAGIISGSGGLTVSGAGGQILAGENTYTGTTTVTGNGELYLGYFSASGSVAGNIVVDAGSWLIFGRTDTYTIQNSITAAVGSTIAFNGGTYSYAGSGVISGAVIVEGATLRLLGSEFNAASVNLSTGGTLSGNGVVGVLIVDAGGTVAPGNSPGTISVNGNVLFNPGSTYRVDVTPSGAHDLISVNGFVMLGGGTVEVVAVPGQYARNSTYVILTNTGTVTGRFDSVTSDYAFLTPTLSYDDHNVYLTLDYSGPSATRFSTFAQTPNQTGVANAAQALGEGNAVFDALLEQTTTSAPAAFNALSGEAYASTGTVIQQQAVYVRDAVGARLMQSLTAPGVSPLAYGAGPQTAALGDGLTPTLWAQGYGGWGNSFSNGNAASISNSIGGFLLGLDVALAPNVRAGVFGGFSQSQFDVTDRSSTGFMNNVDVGVYAGAQFGAFALRGGASYTWHDVSMNRTVAFPGFSQAVEGSYNTGTTQVFGEIGYDFAVGAYAFEPFAGLAYVNVAGASLQEGGGSAGLSVSTSGMDTTYSTLGLRVATTLQVWGSTLTPHATVGWQHAFGDTTPTSTMQFLGGTTPFSVSGVPIAEDAALLQAGLTYALSPKATLGATYTSQLASTASQNAFTAQFSLKF